MGDTTRLRKIVKENKEMRNRDSKRKQGRRVQEDKTK